MHLQTTFSWSRPGIGLPGLMRVSFSFSRLRSWGVLLRSGSLAAEQAATLPPEANQQTRPPSESRTRHRSDAKFFSELTVRGNSSLVGPRDSGGESGIRTHVRVSPKHAFQACAFSHSAISPFISRAPRLGRCALALCSRIPALAQLTRERLALFYTPSVTPTTG